MITKYLWLPCLFYFQEFPPSDEELEAYRNGQVKNYYIRFIYNLSWGINLWRLNEHCLDDEVDRIFLRIFLKPNCFSLVTQVGIRTRWKPFLKVLHHCYKLLHNSGPIRMQAFLSSPEQSYLLYDLIQILSHLPEMMLTILIWSYLRASNISDLIEQWCILHFNRNLIRRVQKSSRRHLRYGVLLCNSLTPRSHCYFSL